ncbi:MAG: hypothetical protein ACM31L_17900 [Actinomycetota bacterium]
MPRAADAGFVLMDVLVALAVLGLALAGLSRAVALGQASVRTGGDRTLAVLVAESVLASARSDGTGTAAGLPWRVTVRPEARPQPSLPPLLRVTVTVGGAGRAVELTTLRLGDPP